MENLGQMEPGMEVKPAAVGSRLGPSLEGQTQRPRLCLDVDANWLSGYFL